MLENLWLGTQASYETWESAKKKENSSGEFEAPSLISVQDGVGVISIRGSLTSGSAGVWAFFGVTGYDDIQAAILEAVANKNVHSILLNIDSGGGAVAGVNDAAKMIAEVNKIKPVVTYTGGMMASAALWLGASAGKSFIGETAIAGSLGVLMVHASRARQLENDGVKVTVIRAGKHKALMNPYEDLTEDALKEAQSHADAMYDVFLTHVADSRGMSLTAADAAFGQGKEFVGKQAVRAGLIDEVGSLSDAFIYAQSLKSSANKPNVRTKSPAAGGAKADNHAEEGADMPKPMTPEHLAALAAGVDLEEAPEAAAQVVEPVAEVVTEAPAPTLESVQAQAAALQAELDTANANITELTAKLEGAAAAEAGLRTIALAGLKTMSLHVSADMGAAEAMAASDLIAEHARVSEAFKAKIKVGGIAATKPKAEDGKPKAALVNPLFLHAVKSSQPK